VQVLNLEDKTGKIIIKAKNWMNVKGSECVVGKMTCYLGGNFSINFKPE
jgi:hypothetical protein